MGARAIACVVILALAAVGQETGGAFTVKLREGARLRIENERLRALEPGTIAGLAEIATARGWRWRRSHAIDAGLMDALRARAEKNLGRSLPDLNLQLDVTPPPGARLEDEIAAARAHPAVEHALPMPEPAPPPLPPDYTPLQGYLGPAPAGGGASVVFTLPGGTGAGITVADLEYSWNLAHADLGLGPGALIGAPGIDPFMNTNHGTAVLGMIRGQDNGSGITGTAPGCTLRVVPTVAFAGPGGWNVGAAITTALPQLVPGDVILIEQQMVGPASAYVPVEWFAPWYGAILLAIGNGITVVEAAGNGQQNLDDILYSTGNGGHHPFLPANDSGAILVGAGTPASDPAVDATRLFFSNYGSTVDLQGWGTGVVTTGYGYLYSAEGPDQWYTNAFAGTSSASAMVAGACVVLQACFKAGTGAVLTPAEVRSILIATGTPQPAANAATEPIGPRPDVAQARLAALQAWTPQLAVTPAAGLVAVANSGLHAGREYYNVFSLEPCPTGLGTGPLLGLFATDVSFILAQVSLPAGAEPFHFIATSATTAFGPYGVPAGIQAEALSVDVTGGVVRLYSPVIAFTTF